VQGRHQQQVGVRHEGRGVGPKAGEPDTLPQAGCGHQFLEPFPLGPVPDDAQLYGSRQSGAAQGFNGESDAFDGSESADHDHVEPGGIQLDRTGQFHDGLRIDAVENDLGRSLTAHSRELPGQLLCDIHDTRPRDPHRESLTPVVHQGAQPG